VTAQALSFDCQGSALVGILHRPERPRRRGIVVIVGGGPQYRVGGHRQLTLWARALCDQGYPVLRFDYRGMGDSQGEFQGFLAVDDDIRCAVDQLVSAVPEVDEVVLWGECDAASAILLYAGRDPRIKGAALLNPWVRTEALQAQAVLRHYYLQRLFEPSLWKKVFGGRFDLRSSLRSALQMLRRARSASGPNPASGPDANAAGTMAPIPRSLPLPQSMLMGLQRFGGPLLLVLSGRDMIAREFEAAVAASPGWQQALASRQTQRHDMPVGDHTFSSAAQRDQVLQWGLQWLRQW
jgi:exosortase A-associated hydrolase 1